MEFHLIWAQDQNGGIGENGRLPWHISEDLKKFKELTLNSTIVMGRKTWESLPIKPLPKRKNIILSSEKQSSGITYHSLKECLAKISITNEKKIFVIGGRSIYKLFFNLADVLHITFINIKNDNVNEFFPLSLDIIKTNFKQLDSQILNKTATYTYWEKIKNENRSYKK